MILDRNALAARRGAAFTYEDVPLPEFDRAEGDDARVRVIVISAGKRAALQTLAEADPAKFTRALVAETAVDEGYKPVFGSPEETDDLPGPVFERLVFAALRVNKMRKDDVEALAKN